MIDNDINEIRYNLDILKTHFMENCIDNWWEIANLELIERHLNNIEDKINRLTSIWKLIRNNVSHETLLRFANLNEKEVFKMVKFTRTLTYYKFTCLVNENGEAKEKVFNVTESNENKAKKELLKSVSNCLIMKTEEVKEKREMTLDDFIANSHVVE